MPFFVTQGPACLVAQPEPHLPWANERTSIMFEVRASPTSYLITRAIFLQLVGLCYFIAFSSYYVQFPGLFGADGLEPAGVALKRMGQSGGGAGSRSGYQSTAPSPRTQERSSAEKALPFGHSSPW